MMQLCVPASTCSIDNGILRKSSVIGDETLVVTCDNLYVSYAL